jgi:hypothetical protein
MSVLYDKYIILFNLHFSPCYNEQFKSFCFFLLFFSETVYILHSFAITEFCIFKKYATLVSLNF